MDGLEKMNGEAEVRFRAIFQHTRLLADGEWAAVIAAPPASMTAVSSVDAAGFETVPIVGFGLGEAESNDLLHALELRFNQASIPVSEGTRRALRRIVEESGGFPRHAVGMARDAVVAAALDGSIEVRMEHAEQATAELGTELARPLRMEDWEILRAVDEYEILPEREGAANLFAHGRILALPPRPGLHLTPLVVHPLLRGDLQRAPN